MAGVFRIEGIVRWGEHASWNALYLLLAGVLRTSFRLLPHVLPIGSSVLQFPGDKGLPLPRHRESDARVRVQSIPQHIAKETQESDQGENEDDDDEREDKGIHSFHFLAL